MSPANPVRSTTTTGGLVPAPSRSTVTSGVTAAGDSVTTGSKTATGGLLSSRLGSALAVTSSPTGSAHSSVSASATPRTRVISYDAGQMALESASANPVLSHDQDPVITGPGRFSGTGAYFGPTDWATMLTPPVRPKISWENTGEVSVVMSHLLLERLPIYLD